jgi:hypothetical protein
MPPPLAAQHATRGGFSYICKSFKKYKNWFFPELYPQRAQNASKHVFPPSFSLLGEKDGPLAALCA